MLIVPDSSSTIKSLFLFLDCVLACVRRRSRCERGRTRRWAVPRASVRGPVPRPRTQRTVPRSGLPGRLWDGSVRVWEGKRWIYGKQMKVVSRWDGWHFCVNCQKVCLYLCGWARRLGDIHLITIKDRVDVSSCLTQLSCKPLDHCVWQRLSINPTS